MRGTGRYWEVLGIGAVGAAGALVFARPLLLLGAIGVWAWALLHQLRFVHYANVVDDNLRLAQTVHDSVVTAGETTSVQLSVQTPAAVPCSVRITSLPPLGATAAPRNERTIHLNTGDSEGETVYDMKLEVAGQTTPRGVEIQLSDPRGLFVHTWQRTEEDYCPSIDVRPYGPRNIHIGSGKESIGRGYGEHDTDHSGGGIEPRELREYVPGDSLGRIDWKATARLSEPYIREYEAAADRQTLLVVDHRAGMDIGDSGQTMLDHARSVGTAVIATAQQLSDPLGWLSIGDDGVTEFVRPKSTPDQYQRAQRTLERLTPTGAIESTQTDDSREMGTSGEIETTSKPNEQISRKASVPSSPLQTKQSRSEVQESSTGTVLTVEDRTRVARYLSDDDSSFATYLRPFFADTTEYFHRISTDPLFHGTLIGRRQVGRTTWFIIITSDQRPAELLETVRTARQDGNHVLVFLTPRVLFGPIESDSIEAAYDRYRAFEQLREQLEQYQRVTVFEVGPRDRLATILSGNPANSTPAEQPGSPSS